MSSQLQNKLFNYEVRPRKEVWDDIATSLDETISPSLSEKLYRFQETPSPAIWQKIISKLDVPLAERSTVVPFHIRYRRPLKYSGAAAILIFLAVVTSLLISKRTESEVPANNIVINQSITEKDTLKAPNNSKETTSIASTGKNHPESFIARSRSPRVKEYPSQNSISLAENFLPKQAERANMISSSLNTDKYMIYSDDDGNVIRLPKKYSVLLLVQQITRTAKNDYKSFGKNLPNLL
jgi:hypothetical protein